MKVTDIIKGLQLIQKSKPKEKSDYHFRAEHDQIYVGSLEWPMSDKDKAEMEELGWEADEDAEGWRTSVWRYATPSNPNLTTQNYVTH